MEGHLSMHLARMDSSMAPPQLFGLSIQAQYSALGLPRNASVYSSGSPATVSEITCLRRA